MVPEAGPEGEDGKEEEGPRAERSPGATLSDGEDLEAPHFLDTDRDFQAWRRRTQHGPGAGPTTS